MASESTGVKDQPYFAASGAPQIDVDPGIVADYAALVGNRKVGTTTERNALSDKALWEGLAFRDITLGLEYVRRSGAWVVAGANSPARDTFQLINVGSVAGGTNLGTVVTVPSQPYAQRVMVSIHGFVSPSAAGDAGVNTTVTGGTAVQNPQIRIYTSVGGQFYSYSRVFYVTVTSGMVCTIRALSEGSVAAAYQVSLETHALAAGEY